jgi:CubicO group peptidase (beta-lactamase class C family)
MKKLQQRLRAGLKKHNVPGATLAVMKNGKLTANVAAGVVNLDTGVKVTTDSVFQIGSITKPITATLIMQLIDEGQLSLEDPVVKHLPEFRVARADVSSSVTIRQLLCHVSGIDGDFFEDTGNGTDGTERLIERARMLPSLFDPGAMMSYCNFGFAVLGRIIEVKRRKSWDDALKDHLYDPLGMTHARREARTGKRRTRFA